MELIDRGKLSLQSAFEKFNVEYGLDGILANLTQWAKNKRPIIDTLRKHPDWNEEALAVVVNITEQRGCDVEEMGNAICGIHDYLYREKNLFETSMFLMSLKPWLLCKTITQDCIDAVKELPVQPPVLPSVGMKCTRFVRKLCESYGVDVDGDVAFRPLFARYADSVSPYEVVRPFIFSVNPADYALMSHGNSWTSCHSIAPRQMGSSGGSSGEYKAGCFSYMNDLSTVVSYTVEKLPNDMATLCLMPKYCRQLYYLSSDGKVFIQSRSYPSVSKETRRDMRRVAHSIISTVYGFDNLWGAPKRSGNRIANQTDYYHYADYHHFSDSTTLSFAAEVKSAIADGSYNSSIPIGNTPLCIVCGSEKMAETNTLYCQACDPNDERDDNDNDEDYYDNNDDEDDDYYTNPYRTP